MIITFMIIIQDIYKKKYIHIEPMKKIYMYILL